MDRFVSVLSELVDFNQILFEPNLNVFDIEIIILSTTIHVVVTKVVAVLSIVDNLTFFVYNLHPLLRFYIGSGWLFWWPYNVILHLEGSAEKLCYSFQVNIVAEWFCVCVFHTENFTYSGLLLRNNLF